MSPAFCADAHLPAATKTPAGLAAPTAKTPSTPTTAPTAAAEANFRQIAQKVRDAKIIDPRLPIFLSTTRDDITILTCARNPDSTELDAKINAILIAKTLFDLDPIAESVLIKFIVHPWHELWTISVKKSLVVDFKSGDISQKAVLNLLTVDKILNFLPPIPGSFFQERKLIYNVLSDFESKHVPNGSLVDYYREVEDAIRKHDNEALDVKFYSLRVLTTAAVRVYDLELSKTRRAEFASAFKGLRPVKPAAASVDRTASGDTAKTSQSSVEPPATPSTPSTPSTSATPSAASIVSGSPSLEQMQALLGEDAPAPGPMLESRCKAAYWIKQASSLGLLPSPELLLALDKANDLAKSSSPKSKSETGNVNRYWNLDFPFLPALGI